MSKAPAPPGYPQQGGYPQGASGYSEPPPPYTAAPPQPYTVYAPPGSTVTVAQGGGSQPKVVKVKQKKGGLFGMLEDAGNYISKEVDYVANKVDSYVQTGNYPMMNNFITNNILQFISRASGRTLQIVMSPDSRLIVDGQGPDDPQRYNSHWTVINEGNRIVRLHNNYNYLCIINGSTMVVNFPQGSHLGNETRLRVVQIGNFVTFESVNEPGRHIGVMPDGTLKSALATGKEDHAQFGVRLVYSPYPPAPQKK
ncbi:uncharacterized protein LOC106173169 isoform X1 [Lingula anatina]|uniref:Uncharacterized protein LOC106173169 isoform X1 n=1 Tax=Lingula anatina TaxID=7574 RepID=A0A1S3JH23_LINAN|nr:uncharacterized protein LOC106173169 isoform X1 [Lingula anatina]|eukprot:XP_013409658.1 uncharacterized protein LOC106173169 isoform X1 [Lingula anatina]